MSNEANLTRLTDEITGEELYTMRHKSGLQIYIMPRKGYKKNYALFSTKYGSIDSEFIVPNETESVKVPDGIAHYLEHKMFDMPNGENIFDRFSQNGADANAFTSFTNTGYLFEATSNVKENLKTLLEYVQTPYFTEESVQKERGIIGQEIKMYDDNPSWAVFFNCLSCMYHNNPVKKDIAGTVESIEKINSDLLYKCYNTFYNLSNMMLFVTGDFDVDEIMEVINSSIKNNEPFDEEIKRIYPSEPDDIVMPYKEVFLSVSQPRFMIAFKDTEVGCTGKELLKKYIETDILTDMITGESSQLFKKLYKSGLINSSLGGEHTVHESFAYTAFDGESENPDKVCDMLLEEIDRQRKEGLNEDDFHRIKKAVWGDYIRSYDDLTGYTHTFVSLAMLGINYMTDFYEVYKSITFEDIKKRFDVHFDKKNCVMSVVKPIE